MTSVNSPVRNKTLITGGFEVYVGSSQTDLQRIGVIKDHTIAFGGEVQDDVYTNYFTRKQIDGNRLTFSASYHEVRPEIFEIINA